LFQGLRELLENRYGQGLLPRQQHWLGFASGLPQKQQMPCSFLRAAGFWPADALIERMLPGKQSLISKNHG
jgi:hypothetical protein